MTEGPTPTTDAEATTLALTPEETQRGLRIDALANADILLRGASSILTKGGAASPLDLVTVARFINDDGDMPTPPPTWAEVIRTCVITALTLAAIVLVVWVTQ